MNTNWIVKTLLIVILAGVQIGCSHSLEITNSDKYLRSKQLSNYDQGLVIGITQFSGNSNEIWFRNKLIEEVRRSPLSDGIVTNYSHASNIGRDVEPDILIDLDPSVKYRTSLINFPINWPGFIIFTPAWNGFVYHADINTHYEILTPEGESIAESTIRTHYNIRQAEFDRTVWSNGIGWLVDPVFIPIGSGIYDATFFDKDVIPKFRRRVEDNYTSYVMGRINPKLKPLL